MVALSIPVKGQARAVVVRGSLRQGLGADGVGAVQVQAHGHEAAHAFVFGVGVRAVAGGIGRIQRSAQARLGGAFFFGQAGIGFSRLALEFGGFDLPQRGDGLAVEGAHEHGLAEFTALVGVAGVHLVGAGVGTEGHATVVKAAVGVGLRPGERVDLGDFEAGVARIAGAPGQPRHALGDQADLLVWVVAGVVAVHHLGLQVVHSGLQASASPLGAKAVAAGVDLQVEVFKTGAVGYVGYAPGFGYGVVGKQGLQDGSAHKEPAQRGKTCSAGEQERWVVQRDGALGDADGVVVFDGADQAQCGQHPYARDAAIGKAAAVERGAQAAVLEEGLVGKVQCIAGGREFGEVVARSVESLVELVQAHGPLGHGGRCAQVGVAHLACGVGVEVFVEQHQPAGKLVGVGGFAVQGVVEVEQVLGYGGEVAALQVAGGAFIQGAGHTAVAGAEFVDLAFDVVDFRALVANAIKAIFFGNGAAQDLLPVIVELPGLGGGFIKAGGYGLRHADNAVTLPLGGEGGAVAKLHRAHAQSAAFVGGGDFGGALAGGGQCAGLERLQVTGGLGGDRLVWIKAQGQQVVAVEGIAPVGDDFVVDDA